MTPTPITQINNLSISTISAATLATEFGKVFNGNIWTTPTIISTLITMLTLVVAIMAFITALNANGIAKSVRSADLLKLFFDLSKALPLDGKTPMSNDHKQLFCNYFDLICMEIKHKRLDKDQVSLVKDAMLMNMFITFMKNARATHGESIYEFYFKWYEKNKKRS